MKARKEKATNSPITTFFRKLAPDAKPKRPKVKINPITTYFSKRTPLAPLNTSPRVVQQVKKPQPDSPVTSAAPHLPPPGNLPAKSLQEEAKSPSSQPDGFVIIQTPPGNLLAKSLQEEAKCSSSQPENPAVTSIAPHSPPPGRLPAIEHSSASLFNVTAPQLTPLPTKPVPQPSPVLSTVSSLNTHTMPGNAVKNCQGDPETDTILITDSSLLSDCSVVDLTHDNPSPKKRVCLIDLTESPASLLMPTPVAVNKSEENHTVDEWRQQSTDTVAHSGGEEERTAESSSMVMTSVSLSAVAKEVESFHLTTPTNLQHTPGPEPMVVEHPVHTMSEHASPTQVQPVTASSPLLTSLFLSSDHTDVFDQFVPPFSLQEELEPLLWQRGIPYSKVPAGHSAPIRKVHLFSTVQDNIVDNLLEVTSAVTSRKLHSVLEYLTLTTTATLMPRASILHSLWEMVADPHVSVNRLSTDSMLRCITFLRRLLSLHPPGQHPLVDTQYREFVRSLGEVGGPFATWEWINGMISGPELCAQLLSFLVDLFLSDFWTCLTSKMEPLFVKVFWLGSGSGSGSGHVTLPIRRLVDASVQLVEKPGYQDSEFSKLGSCTSLLFLAATRCQDLSTELTTACRRLPSDKLLYFISHLHPTSLQVKLLHQTNTAPRLQLIFSSIAKQLPSSSTGKTQHIPHQQEREGHTTSAQQPPSMRSDADTSKTDGGQSTKVQSPPCAIVLAQPVSRSMLKADLKIATLNSNKAQHSNTTSLASNRFVAPPVRIHGQPNPKTVALTSMQRRPQGGPISHYRPAPLPNKTPATQSNPKTAALTSAQRRPQGGTIFHYRPAPLPTKTPATQPNPKTAALTSVQRRPQGGPISHYRPAPLPTKTPATQPNPKTVALSSTQRRPQGGKISHCRPASLPTKTPATQPNPKTAALTSVQRRPQGGPISHYRPAPLPTKTPATQSSTVKGLAHQSQTLSAQSLSAIHKASMSSSSLQERFLLSGTHSSKVPAK